MSFTELELLIIFVFSFKVRGVPVQHDSIHVSSPKNSVMLSGAQNFPYLNWSVDNQSVLGFIYRVLLTYVKNVHCTHDGVT